MWQLAGGLSPSPRAPPRGLLECPYHVVADGFFQNEQSKTETEAEVSCLCSAGLKGTGHLFCCNLLVMLTRPASAREETAHGHEHQEVGITGHHLGGWLPPS